MLFTYDKNTVQYKDVTKKVILQTLGAALLIASIVTLILFMEINNVRFITQETKTIIINEKNEFTPEKLKAYILELNIRFPYIVYAQARLETGNFKADLFKTNKNLFAMRIATKRPTTNKGVEYGYAVYDSWRESVVDYAFFSAQYLSDIKTETEYLEYLRQNYAIDPTYVDRLKVIITEEKNKKVW